MAPQSASLPPSTLPAAPSGAAPAQAADVLAEAIYSLKQARLPIRDVATYVPGGPTPLPAGIAQVVEGALAHGAVAFTGAYEQGGVVIAAQAADAQGSGALLVLMEPAPALPEGLGEASALLAERFPGAALSQPVAAPPGAAPSGASDWAEGYLLQGAAAETAYLGACLPHQGEAVVLVMAATGSLSTALNLR